MNQKELLVCAAGAAAGVILACYADICHAEPVILKQLPVTQQEVLSKMTMEQFAGNTMEAISFSEEAIIFPAEAEPMLPAEEKPEEWYGTDRKLTDFEWDALSQMIMAEARGESFEVQYLIACVVLNRVDSPLFPNTVAGVIYQTQPVQFSGAWSNEWYEPTDCVLEAIQAALEENRTPLDLFYFTSEGWLPGTEPWMRAGGMWFSRQGD